MSLLLCAEMYRQCPGVNLRLYQLPAVTSGVDGPVSCDRSLTCELPVSPGSQLMYESEPLQDQCCVTGQVQPDQPVVETGVISPSVEGLTFSDCDVLSYVFASEPRQPLATAASSSDEVLNGKYLSDTWTISDSDGPTLTQLNSDDLDSALLDDFSVPSSGFYMDCSPLTAVSNLATSSVPSTATTTTLAGWSEQREQPQPQWQSQLISHLLSSQLQADSVQHDTHPASSSSASLAASAAPSSVDCNWAAIESFLKSENARMAAVATNDHHWQQQCLQLATGIKAEVRGISQTALRTVTNIVSLVLLLQLTTSLHHLLN